MHFWSQVWWLFHKELLLEWRHRELIVTIFFFAILSISVFGLSLQTSVEIQKEVLPGILWVTLAFAGALGMGKIYQSEQEEDALDGLRMAPISREAIFVAKHLALLVFLLSCALWAIPLSVVMFQADITQLLPDAILLFVLGLWGFAILGTLLATLTVRSQFQEALLPLLFLPIALPLLIAGARATAELLGVGGIPHTSFWIRGFLLFDILFLVVGLWLFETQFGE